MWQRLLKYYQNNYLAILAIIGLTFLVWGKILNQVFLGEGYMYFARYYTFFKPQTFQDFNFIRFYDNFAKILFDIFPPFFKDNIQPYLFLELLIIIILYLSIYFVITTITKSRMVGFTTTVFFLANYVGSFYLIAEGNYQRFVQRIPNFIPVVFSFYYLYKFYDEKKIKYYFFSILFYFLALFLSHFSSIILPLFLFYPLVHLLQEKKSRKVFLTRIITVVPFLLVTYFITTSTTNQAPANSFWQFLQTEPDILKRVLYQIPLITVPLDLIKFSAQKILINPESEPYTHVVPFFTVISLIFYFFGGLIVYKRRRDLLVLYLTSFLAMIGSMLLYVYVDTRINPLKYFSADRFFLVPSLLAAVCWAILLQVLFIQKKLLYKIISVFILAYFVFFNTQLIWSKIDSIQYKSEMLKSFLKYVKENSSQFNSQTVIIVPSYLQWPVILITDYGNHPSIQAIVEFDGWEKKYWDTRENVYVYDYEFDKNIDKTTHPYAGHVVDFTQNYRRGEKIQFLN